jgi:hypothetical protein
MRHWPKAAAIGAALVCIASCGPLGTPRSCTGDSDCSSSSVCAQGVCADMRADDCRRVACAVSIVAPSSTSFTGGAVAFQVSISGTVPDKVELLRDGSPLATLPPPFLYTWDTSAEGEGSHEIVARATQGPTVFVSEPRTVVVSRTLRAISISSPSSTIFADGLVPFQLTLSGMPPDKVDLLKNGSLLATLSPPYEYTWDTTLEAEGTYQIVARGSLGSAVFSSEPRTVVVSRVAQAVAISSPVATAFTNGQVTFEVIFSGFPPDAVELIKNGSPFAVLEPPYQYSWDTTSEPEGTYQVVARATQGGKTYSSEARTVVVDRTPPVVVGHSPASGDTNVALRAPVYVQFSEPVLLPAGAAGSVVSLTGAGSAALSAQVDLSGDLQTLLISYAPDPAVPSDVALSLRPGITDLAGNPLVLPAPWGWHMPMWQRLGTVRQAPGIGGCDLALDAAGRPTVAWSEADGLWVARWTGNAWETIGASIRGPGTFASGPLIALKPTGDPVLAWYEDTDPGSAILYQIIVKHRTPNGWDYMGQNPVGEPGTNLSDLVIDAGGGVWLGTNDCIGCAVSHAVVRKYDGSMYWPRQGGSLNRAARNATGPRLAFDAGGALWAAWTESAGFPGIDNYLVYDVFTSRLEAGVWAGVGGALNANASAPAYSVSVVSVPGGFPALTWKERLGSFNYKAWYRAAGAYGWGSQQPAAYPSTTTPPLAATGSYLYSAGPSIVYRSLPGGAWESVGADEFHTSASPVAIRTTVSGEVLLLWMEAASLTVSRLNR